MCFSNTAIARGAGTEVVLFDNLNAGIGKHFNNLWAFVGRAVINDDHFKIGESLGGYGRERAFDEGRFVEEWNDYRDAHGLYRD